MDAAPGEDRGWNDFQLLQLLQGLLVTGRREGEGRREEGGGRREEGGGMREEGGGRGNTCVGGRRDRGPYACISTCTCTCISLDTSVILTFCTPQTVPAWHRLPVQRWCHRLSLCLPVRGRRRRGGGEGGGTNERAWGEERRERGREGGWEGGREGAVEGRERDEEGPLTFMMACLECR